MVTAPRVVVAAANSSAGKTTIATGLLAALRASGTVAQGFKVGPDYIDPGYHALATGRPGRNLDPVMVGEDLIAPLVARGMGPVPRVWAADADVAGPARIGVVEGVMGLFDGQLDRDGFGSTAHVASLIDAPVLLVVDAAGSSRTAAASALGLAGFDPRIRLGGVIFNRVGSPRHESELRGVAERAGMPVLGALPRSSDIVAPSRHLGLVPVEERDASAEAIRRLTERVAAHVDLDAVLALADSAPALDATPWEPGERVSPVEGRPRIGVLGGRAFTFRYAETTELLDACGCDVVSVDPLSDAHLPADLRGLYLGGGFPEVYAPELSENASLRADVRTFVADDGPTVAECAGLLYLGTQLDGHPMVGAVDASARMTPRLTLGYREATAASDSLLLRTGERVTGHEFHRTQTVPGSSSPAAWSWDARGRHVDEGFCSASLCASYLHLHWAGTPHLAQRFADAAASFGGVSSRPAVSARVEPAGIDLRHHGDRDVASGLVDLAVNVMRSEPPAWLEDAIVSAPLAPYPDVRAAREAIAARHGVDPSMVLPTAGASEAFTLIARTLPARNPLVVHPQFTEPEAALRASGVAVQRWLLPVGSGGTPTLGDLPSWADALFIGNPTNPTGWLHEASALVAAGEGRLLIVDEAFMDAAGERETLIAPSMPGRLVVRSLSKTWGLAGLRVGYVVGDPAWITRLEAAQPAWPLSSPAIAAMVATAAPEALAEADAFYATLRGWRDHLVGALAAAGFSTEPSEASFVLVDTSPCGPASVRVDLARHGFAIRRGETIPGLDAHHIRVRVVEPETANRFVAALVAVREERHG